MASKRSEDLTVFPSTATALPVASTGPGGLPALYAPDARAARRALEFFTAHIRNPHTRKAYAEAALSWVVSLLFSVSCPQARRSYYLFFNYLFFNYML